MNLEILLDSNSIHFLYKNLNVLRETKDNFSFYILPSQEREINGQLGVEKHKTLKNTLNIYNVEKTPGVFFLNVPNINVSSYFVDSKIAEKIRTVLLKHNCMHIGTSNFMADFDIAYSAFINKYTVLTNDGAGKKDGLYRALKELNIACLSHNEFEKLICF